MDTLHTFGVEVRPNEDVDISAIVYARGKFSLHLGISSDVKSDNVFRKFCSPTQQWIIAPAFSNHFDGTKLPELKA